MQGLIYGAPNNYWSCMKVVKRIKINRARCRKCGWVIESQSRYHLNFCGCGSIFVDGGQEYLRRGGDLAIIEEASEWEEVEEVAGFDESEKKE